MRPLTEFHGPALFSYGFRPFFLAATLFGLCVVPIWWLIWRGQVPLAGPFIPADWHIHEMIFGYGGAVLAGFFHYVRIGPNRVEEDEHPTPPDTSVHVVDPAVHTFDPRGEDRP